MDRTDTLIHEFLQAAKEQGYSDLRTEMLLGLACSQMAEETYGSLEEAVAALVRLCKSCKDDAEGLENFGSESPPRKRANAKAPPRTPPCAAPPPFLRQPDAYNKMQSTPPFPSLTMRTSARRSLSRASRGTVFSRRPSQTMSRKVRPNISVFQNASASRS